MMDKISFPTLKSDDKILIVGGYGQVGSMVAEYLALLFPQRIVIAGRNGQKAKNLAAKIGYATEGRAIDIFSPENFVSLIDIGFVLVCLDQSNINFVTYCIENGVSYLDITANYSFLVQLDGLDHVAKKAGATILLSIGLSPGLTNLLAAYALKQMPEIRRLDILLELGLGDQHGKAAINWMLDNLGSTFEIREKGVMKSVKSFGQSLDLTLPGSKKSSAAWRFNFSDQQVLARTLDIPSVSTGYDLIIA